MSRLERLVNLLTALTETERPLSRSDLHRRVPGYASEQTAFRRAFERDKETLRSMGVPIQTMPLDPEFPEHGDGYRVLKDEYFLPDPGLTHEEMSALAIAASAVKLKSQSATAALWRLGGDVIDVTTTEDVELPESDELSIVFAARRERRRITFSYKGTERQLDPYRLTFRNGRWYVNGFDHGHGDVRTYRLDRMGGAITAGDADSFPAPARVDQPWLPAWQMGDGTPVETRVYIDASQADLAIDQAGENCIEERRPDGGVVLRMMVTNQEAFRSFVLGFLEHAEILTPADARQAMIDYLEAVVA